jgi:trimeric autotransporter adhesin
MALHVCVRGIGIRRSKDLRARSRKFLNLTNERKKMSTKTIYKRIALVAVAALGAGVLSVAPANATFAAGDIVVKTASGVYNGTADVCANTTASGVDSAVIPLSSAGIWLTTHSGADANDDPALAITGPGVFSTPSTYYDGTALVGTKWALSSATLAVATNIAAGGSDSAGVVADHIQVRPTAVGTIKVSTYATSALASVVDVITITVVAACAGDAYASSQSYFTAVNSTEAANGSWTQTVLDTTGVTRVTDDGLGYVKIRLNDAYGENLVTQGALIATVTGANCLVGLAAHNGTLAAGKSASAVLSTAGADNVAIVEQATAGTPATCALSVSFNGTVIGTKSFTFEGAPSTITVSDVTVGSTTANTGLYRVSVTDAAGNTLSGQVISASSTEANNAAAIASGVISSPQATSGAATISAADATDGKTKAVAYADRADANMTSYTCAKEGTAKLTVRTPVDAGAAIYITSAPFNVVCGGALATWSVSMDKATYAPGEIATLTLSGKTALGNPVATFTFLSGVEASFGGMTAVTAPTNNDAFSSGLGTKTYQYSVGTSEGAFVGTFKTTGTTDTAAKTVQYKIAGAAGVSNADVLKAIVSLIASINKQIAALQKALLRR